MTHPFIKGFALPQEHDISLDEIRIECLHDAQNNIPRGRESVMSNSEGESLNIRKWKCCQSGKF